MHHFRRVLAGHQRFFAALVAGVASLFLLPHGLSPPTRGIMAWNVAASVFLLLCLTLFGGTASPERMAANARHQEEGEWTLFWVMVAGATASFAAILGEFGSLKGAAPGVREVKLAVVGSTLLLSWLLMHTIFALRYAHEYYQRTGDAEAVDGGLDFPREPHPDYWDFFYFAAVLGMTFQVSDVQITSRKLRRLATLHGMLGFMFNTVIVALTVNLASGLLG
jgi:uncharacterized membrane protein